YAFCDLLHCRASLPVHGCYALVPHQVPHSFPTRRSSDLRRFFSARQAVQLNWLAGHAGGAESVVLRVLVCKPSHHLGVGTHIGRSEEHTSELQSRENLVCRLLLEKKIRTAL